MYIDAALFNGKIVVWYRDLDGKLYSSVEDAPYYLYHEVPNGEHETIFGHRVNKVEFGDYHEFKHFKEHHDMVFESDISPLHKFLSDNFYKITGPVHKGYFDIEVEYDLSKNMGYPTVDNPYGRINAITLFDCHKNEYHIFMLTDDNSIAIKDGLQNLSVVNHHARTEKELLDAFFLAIEDIDMLSGWNTSGYDIPMLTARASRVYPSTDESRTKLCRDGYKIELKDGTNPWGQDITKYIPVGRAHLDLMELYMKFTEGELESYRLDVVAEKELGMNKREYKGDLGELYRTNPREFFEYSFHDTRLLKFLDDKTKLLDLAIMLARRATIRYDEVLGSVRPLEMSIRNYCHHDRQKMVVLPDRLVNKRGELEGGFVIETAAGVYGWTQSIDVSALYPSVIRALNISPETHLFQCAKGHQDFLKIVQQTDDVITLRPINNKDGAEIKIPAKDIHHILREHNMTLSANGSCFNKEETGIIPEILTIWAQERAEAQAAAKNAEMDGKIMEASQLNLLQKTLKLSANSLYGVLSNPYSRFFSLELGNSITLTGRTVCRFQSYMADKYLQEAV